MSPETPAELIPTSNIEMVGEAPKAEAKIDPMELMRKIPFGVPSRSRAQKLAKVLYGPQARVWINRSFNRKIAEGFSEEEQMRTVTLQREVGICVGTEQGAEKQILSGGKDFSEALRLPTETYIKGGLDYEDTRKRIRTVSSFCNQICFIEDALGQFQEYQNAKNAEQEKALDRMKKVLEKGAQQVKANQLKAAVAQATV